ncbi:unnamed protein product [Symbiodinium necroappetens]|uniref:Uncharacterized protein n=1 Tax=Symbiodinium necroappetens TaxID=1628268 RepID=A0A812MNM0_9DINO|nr:unnamed protein product [Symbiodinium sp. KB8]CAE7257732.1 unnamed protein product [Symbiodinium microadriaticum]CAE7272460.1 unnamed protein product [Symbiodinium necroappetens]
MRPALPSLRPDPGYSLSRSQRMFQTASAPQLPAITAAADYLRLPRLTPAVHQREARHLGGQLRPFQGMMASDIIVAEMENRLSVAEALHKAAQASPPERQRWAPKPKTPPAVVSVPTAARALGPSAPGWGAAAGSIKVSSHPGYLPPWISNETWDTVQQVATRAATKRIAGKPWRPKVLRM